MMRRYIRHPVEIPVNITVSNHSLVEVDVSSFSNQSLSNISEGGLAFCLYTPIKKGMKVSVSMPTISPVLCATGTAVWCKPFEDIYEVGVQFADNNEAFKARMVAQLSHIEHYKDTVQSKEGRYLSRDEAALEWIVQHAEEFALAMGQ